MAPAHATVDSTLAKFRMPGTSCLTTCALAAVAIRPTTVNSASVGFTGRMPAPPFDRCSLPLRASPRAPCERQTGATAKDVSIATPAAMNVLPVKYAQPTCHGSHPGTSAAVPLILNDTHRPILPLPSSPSDYSELLRDASEMRPLIGL